MDIDLELLCSESEVRRPESLRWVFEAEEMGVGGMTVGMVRRELRKVTFTACFVFLLYIFDPREF